MYEIVDIVKIVDPLHVGAGITGQFVQLVVNHDVIDHWEGD